MKAIFHLLNVCVFLACALDCAAQSASSREFARLKGQRDWAVTTAITPIDQKYHEVLKPLLTRASQEGDFATVTAITEVLSDAKKPSEAKLSDTPSCREFIRLKDQRDRAVATAITPIDQKYHELLKPLLTRATQEGDFATVTAITEVLSAAKDSATAKRATASSAGIGVSNAGIWAPTNNDNFWYVIITNADNSVEGFIYVGAAKKTSEITGKKMAGIIEAHWDSVYLNESWDGKLTERPGGGFDLERVNFDGPSKGRRDTFELKRLTGDEYKRVRKLMDSTITTKESKRDLRKLPRE